MTPEANGHLDVEDRGAVRVADHILGFLNS
jgi:hypothetical protein